MTLMFMSKMQCQLENYNSNKLIREMSEKLKHRSHSKMCLVPSNQDEHSDETQDSEANLDRSKQCSNSLTPTNRSRLKNFFMRETKPDSKLHKTNLRCAEVSPPKEHPREPYNVYCVPAGDDNGSPTSGTSRCVDNEADIYEEVSEHIPYSPSLDKTSSIEKEEAHEAGSEYQNITVRPLSGSQVCPARKNRKPPYVTTYDSVRDDEHTGTNYNLNPIASSLYEAERVPVLPIEVRKPLQADSSVSKKPPPVLPKAACIKRNSSKKIHQEWCELKNDSTSQLGKPLPPVPAERRPSSLPPNKELPEIEEELELFRAVLKQQKDVDSTKIVFSNVNFTGRMVDSRGGRLQLKSHGVGLYIPPGALRDKPREIFIYVQQNLKSSHHTVKNGFVSPIVHCGTSGLKFNIPVILTFPVHVKDSSRWELTGVRQDSSTKPWEDISDRSSDTMLFNDNLCTVIVDHFTGFGAVGRPTELQASCVLPLRVKVYISQNNAIDPVHGCVELRVYFCDESLETCEEIKNKEKDSKLLLDKSRGFFLHISENGTHGADLDVTFELECLNKPWKTSFKKQVLSLARCEVSRQVKESCTLNLKVRNQDAATGSEHRPLECEISICQSSYEDFGVTVRAVDKIGVRDGRESTGHGTIGIRLNDFDPMSLGRYRKLSTHLDSERRWKLLVKPCFIGQEAEQDFDKYGNPSAVVLGIVFLQGSIRESSMTTLVRLRSMLNECKLVRAAQIVHDDINDLKERYSYKDDGDVFVHAVQCSDDLQNHSDEAKLHRPTQTSVRNDDEDHYEVIQSDGQNDVRPSNHLQKKTPEENDEFPDQIHTLQSNQFISTNTGPNNSVLDGGFHFQRQNPEPTQDNWPSQTSQEDEELDSSYAHCPQTFNSHYQNLPKSIANLDTSGYICLGVKK